MRYRLPVDYTKLDWRERRVVRQQYIEQQLGKCYFCKNNLHEKAPAYIVNTPINWKLFPTNFLQYPIHLQHNHDTGMTEGAVHNYCNAIMWQYEGR